ncbi:unnamed protein product [Prorocentrum cordatum]|uniref:JmjC domain-containing protein n=1 Tax=Prorocentrum cordatum TaxID=2364126 RepID=A0ABN9XEM6_9DINO|nr:unnamed protein product [Polarella glacialis]
MDPELGVPVEEIPRLRYPEELGAERFEAEFASRGQPVVIEGLVDDWPAHQEGPRCWRGRRVAEVLADGVFECNFEPADNRMYRFEDGNPSVLLSPGRLRLTYAAFREVAEVRAEIARLRRASPGAPVDLGAHPRLRQRLQAPLVVQNVPPDPSQVPARLLEPLRCRVRDLVPLAFYAAGPLPEALRGDVAPQHAKLLPAWGPPAMERCWATPGGPFRAASPPWSEAACPTPGEDPRIYSCFHFDRMENLHSLLAGEKEALLVAHRDAHVLKGTRFAQQKQWVVAPVPASAGGEPYLGPALLRTAQTECASDQSAVHPLRPARENRLASGGQWPDDVVAPVLRARLRKGDTLYIPAHHWHFVASEAPPTLAGGAGDGPLATSVNFWWWPLHGVEEKRRWTAENEVWSRANARVGDPEALLAALGRAAAAAAPEPARRPPSPEYEAVD